MILKNTGEFILTLLAALPFLFLALRSGRINLDHKERGHQFILPFIALLYSIVMIIFLNQVTNWLVGLVGSLGGILPMIPRVGSGLYSLWKPFYSMLHAGYGIQLLFDTFFMLGFCILKRLLLPIIRKYWHRWRTLYNYTTGYFYDELGRRTVLRQEYSNLRDMLRVCYGVSVVLGYLTGVLSYIFSDSLAFAFPFYPVFAIIVIGEIWFFLDGRSFDEYSFSGEPGDDPNIADVDCEDLLKDLGRVFRDRVNLADSRPRSAAARKRHDWEKELMDGDDLDRITGSYFAAMKSSGEYVQPDYVQAARDVLHGKNILVHNPFYRDMTRYLLLPIFHALLNNHACLIICGRMTDENDIIRWLQDGIREVTNLPKLWNIRALDEKNSAGFTDIGILGFERLYDMDSIRSNHSFFERTTLVIMLEPSNLLGTGQMGLRSVVEYCEAEQKQVSYCALDRNADGLVDALSHVIRQSVTEVVASQTTDSAYCRMFWRAEGPGVQTRILPRISHYMGIGGEISAQAMHNGVPNVHWFSGSKIPLLDLRWNIQQYFAPICRYIHSPQEQEELTERFHFHDNLWQADLLTDAFVIAEDEFCNVFEMSRTFAARIRHKGFVNILSEAYMLRDYMCANQELFTNDPKAIPSIVPDYARTERNFVFRTLIRMASDDVFESDLQKELSLHGHETKNAYETFRKLVILHTGKEDIRIRTHHNEGRVGFSSYSKFSYSVDKSELDDILHAALKTAHYVVENEQTERYPIGNRLMDHIEQTLLPGQFFCYDGKYYQVRSISPQSGIIVRRSGDHINGRVYYRQLKDYQIKLRQQQEDARDIRGMQLRSCFADMAVRTDGYLEMPAANALPQATVIRLDNVRIRQINYKELLIVQLADASPEICFTICVLLNELFRTLYPNEADYITVVTEHLPESVRSHSDYADRLRVLVPGLQVDKGEQNCIYFIEDSNIDLGLLVSIERNFVRILEIITDYLDWYLDPKRPKGDDAVYGNKGEAEDENDIEESDGSDETDGSEKAEGSDAAGNAVKEQQEHTGTVAAGDTIFAAYDLLPSEVAKGDVEGEDEELIDAEGIRSALLKRMEYLAFGYSQTDTPEWLNLEETFQYLTDRRFHESNLQRTRKKPKEFDEGSTYDPHQPGVHYCDFCGAILEPDHYDVLKDGRERCPECSATAIKTGKQFKKVFSVTLDEMERSLNIKINVPIKVRMVNARKVNDGFGMKPFEPTPGFDGRVLGFAEKSRKGYRLLVESGAPEWTMKSTLVHELTHIWQFENWKDDELEKITGGSPDLRSFLLEGMAVWTEVQYLMCMGQKDRAIRYKRNRDMDPSVYGAGMKAFIASYPVQDKTNIPLKKSPFGKFPPIRLK